MNGSPGLTNSFKVEILTATHNLTPGQDSLKGALYYQTATISKAATAYTTTGELVGAGYNAGGIPVNNTNAPASDGSNGVAHWTPSAAFVWNSITIAQAVDSLLLYNATAGKSNKSIALLQFSAVQLQAPGTLTLSQPVDDGNTGLIRIA